MQIASEICIYTNDRIIMEELDLSEDVSQKQKSTKGRTKGSKG